MELIDKRDLLFKLAVHFQNGQYYDKGIVDLIKSMPTKCEDRIIHCQDCANLTPREELEEYMQKGLPEYFIGHCDVTDLYVRENDYCSGAD